MSLGTVYDTAYRGDFNQIKVKMDADNSLVRTPDENGRLLIHWAALGGNDNLVEYLIDSGSPVDPLDDTDSTPLILAGSAGKYDVVKLLIGRGANVNHKNKGGQTALLYACSKGHTEVAKLLIEVDANFNHSDLLGATALHRAASQGRMDIVKLLLGCPNLEINATDCTGSSPLHLACEEDREAVATLLVVSGASVELINKQNKKPTDLGSPRMKKTMASLQETFLK